jgi:hypothetical protein
MCCAYQLWVVNSNVCSHSHTGRMFHVLPPVTKGDICDGCVSDECTSGHHVQTGLRDGGRVSEMTACGNLRTQHRRWVLRRWGHRPCGVWLARDLPVYFGPNGKKAGRTTTAIIKALPAPFYFSRHSPISMGSANGPSRRRARIRNDCMWELENATPSLGVT